MRIDFSAERVLAVVAHPDDAELLCAGTLARAAADGAEVSICVCCQGDKGQPLTPIAELAAVRREEMEEAAALIPCLLFSLGAGDSELENVASMRLALLDVLRAFRPSLILSHSPQDYHADHRAAANLVRSAGWLSASPGIETTQLPLPVPPAVWEMDTLGMHGFEPEFYIDVSEFVDLKERMLACHRSQISRGRDGTFPPLLEEMRCQLQTRGRQSGVRAAEAFRTLRSFRQTRAW